MRTTSRMACRIVLAIAAASLPVGAQLPGTAFTYQGRLDDAGRPAEGLYDFEFSLWTVPAGGTIFAGPVLLPGVPIAEGVFTVQVDFGPFVELCEGRWLEIAVRNAGVPPFTTLTPRQELTPVPFAICAQVVPWDGITGLPAGFADGIDDVGANYTAGSGITIAGETISIASGGIQTGMIGDGQVTERTLADGAVSADKIGTRQVTTAKLDDEAVTQGKLGRGSVGEEQLRDDGVTTDKLDDRAVTHTKIEDNAVRRSHLADGVVDTEELVANAVEIGKIDASDGVVGEAIVVDRASSAKWGHPVASGLALPYTDSVFASPAALQLTNTQPGKYGLYAINSLDGAGVYGVVNDTGPGDNGAGGVYGRHQARANFGYLGTYNYGVRGIVERPGDHAVHGRNSSDGSYGFLGGELKGVFGQGHIGVHGRGAGFAGYFEGKVAVRGPLFKNGGGFQIDHPLDPENKYLNHSFVESPDMMNVYNGNVVLDALGEAEINLPDYFDELNRDFRYQLTAIGSPGPNLHVRWEIGQPPMGPTQFYVAGGSPGQKISWQVTGIRQDQWANENRVPIEEPKE